MCASPPLILIRVINILAVSRGFVNREIFYWEFFHRPNSFIGQIFSLPLWLNAAFFAAFFARL
jgi:hypothetical protein